LRIKDLLNLTISHIHDKVNETTPNIFQVVGEPI